MLKVGLACFQHLGDFNWLMKLMRGPDGLKTVLPALHMALAAASKTQNASLNRSDQLDFAKC